MRNKKLLTPLFLAASFMLIGCSADTIVARPAWQLDKIIEGADSTDNKMKNIYDAVKALGDTNSNVLTRVMYDIAKTHLGVFDKTNDANELTLKQIATTNDFDYKSEKFEKFVNSHPIYKAADKGAKLVSGKATEVDLGRDDKLKISYEKIKQQYNQILNDIAEKLYDEIKGGSYSDSTSKLFSEINYIMHLKKELYDIKGGETATLKDNLIFLPKDKNTEFKNYITTYLTISDIADQNSYYYDYIERKILPDLYKTYLAQTYVYQQRYSSLGRSYARKVNMITIARGDMQTRGNILRMLQYFAKNYLAVTDKVITYSFEDLNRAMIGFVGAPDKTKEESQANLTVEYKLLNFTNNNEPATPSATSWQTRSNFTLLTASKGEALTYRYRTNSDGSRIENPFDPNGTNKTYVYKGTKLGDIIEKLKECCIVDGTGNYTIKEPSQLDSKGEAALNELTGNHKYNIEAGLVIKEREARLTDMTKDGWFLKNGGLTDLNSTFRDKLFNISTSNLIDKYKKKSGEELYKDEDYVRYFGSTASAEDISKRKAFLTTDTTSSEPYDSIVLDDKSSNYYIVEVEEATNTSKLADADNERSYLKLKATEDATYSSIEANKIIRDVVKANASSDTYKNNANQYYLMISNIIFYDQSVYDYFKSQFPDLFK